jgi:hypothetical protein
MGLFYLDIEDTKYIGNTMWQYKIEQNLDDLPYINT